MPKLLEDVHHPLHPGVSCPRCGKHSVMKIKNEDRYACLNCSWQRDIANDGWGPMPFPVGLLFTLLIVVWVILLSENRATDDPTGVIETPVTADEIYIRRE